MIQTNRRAVLGGLAVTAAVAPFAPLGASERPFSFLVVGDWGRDGAQHQRDVADAMGRAAADAGARFIISVGDNFYEDGVQSAADAQWRTSFEAIYTAPSLQVPWFVALGNHDYRGNPQAQIDYAAKSGRWRMPKRYYQLSGTAFGAPELDLFVIDTSPLVHKYREKVDAQIARNVAGQDADAQLAWLDRSLAASTAPIKLVIGHHTLRSGGSGHGETPEIVERVLPLLKQRRVAVYINGHDHDLQHIRADGLDYLCCGAGSEVRPVKRVAGTQFCAAQSGFALLTLAGSELAAEFRDYTGQRLYAAPLRQGA
ncbi:MAG: metallophosphoesterase [Sphingomonas sp.]|nr:metallophosphoesterase [Sphingomonas sp.]